jgi:rubrerythrin
LRPAPDKEALLGIDKRERTASTTAAVQSSGGAHRPRSELRCVNCGYGAIAALPIRCPMCGGEVWDFVDWRPFAR